LPSLELVAQEPVRLKFRPFPSERCPSDDGPKLDLKVIFTDLPKTAAALATARTMARGLDARITLIAAQVVPYPRPLADPDVPVEFTRKLMETVATGESTTVEILLCRDRYETIRHALPQDSVVILGTRKRHWWPSWERRLASMLHQDGRRVLVIAL
jgi:hypothetical protein